MFWLSVYTCLLWDSFLCTWEEAQVGLLHKEYSVFSPEGGSSFFSLSLSHVNKSVILDKITPLLDAMHLFALLCSWGKYLLLLSYLFIMVFVLDLFLLTSDVYYLWSGHVRFVILFLLMEQDPYKATLPKHSLRDNDLFTSINNFCKQHTGSAYTPHKLSFLLSPGS